MAVFRFPPRTRCAAGATVTIWAGGATEPIKHQPPADLVFREQLKWGTGPECTTILCKPNGQVGSALKCGRFRFVFEILHCTFRQN